MKGVNQIRFAHCNIISKDWRKLSEFYISVFDCVIQPPVRNQSGEWLSQGTGVPNASLEGVHLLLPGHGDQGPTLEIYGYPEMKEHPGRVPNSIGNGHLAFEVGDVDATIEKLKRFGGTLHGKVTKRTIPGLGTITFVYAKDPEGNFIEIQNWTYD